MKHDWLIQDLLVWRRTDDGLRLWKVLLPKEVELIKSVIENHPLLTWEEAVIAVIEAPP